jgi:hypothetical protein
MRFRYVVGVFWGLLARTNAWLRPYGFVLYSTPASVRARWPSVLACVETAVAVATYWWIALRFDTQRHLWISVCVAPLLLLRSKASIARGVKWFTAYIDERLDPFENMTRGETLHTWRFWEIVGLSALASATLFYWFARFWLVDYEGWSLFWRSAIVGWLSLNVGFAAFATAAGGPAPAAAAAGTGAATGERMR